MVVNSRNDVQRAVRLFDEPWFRNSLAARNPDGERVLIAAGMSTPLGEVLDALEREGGAGNLVVFHEETVIVLVIETVDAASVSAEAEGPAVGRTTTVAELLDVYRGTANHDTAAFAILDDSRRVIRATGLHREAIAA